MIAAFQGSSTYSLANMLRFNPFVDLHQAEFLQVAFRGYSFSCFAIPSATTFAALVTTAAHLCPTDSGAVGLLFEAAIAMSV